MLEALISKENVNYSPAAHSAFLVDKLCISNRSQSGKFCYDVSSSLKERSGRRKVKWKLFVSR
jgi:hypothetical protein